MIGDTPDWMQMEVLPTILHDAIEAAIEEVDAVIDIPKSGVSQKFQCCSH